MGNVDKGNNKDLSAIKSSLRTYITDSLLPASGIESFEDGDSFLGKGIIDSTGILELLEFIESKFQIHVEDEEVVPDNLDSLDKLSSFIHRKTGDEHP
jgi:acyl carrier protein